MDLKLLPVPSGEVSVMPQPCSTSTPMARNARIIEGGTAEPPIMVRRSELKRSPLPCIWLSNASHTVGTPAAMVTCSASMSSYTDLPSSAGPGNTIFIPASGAPYGRPQPFTWNIGTTGSTAPSEVSACASGSAAVMACSKVERWL